MDVLPDGGHHGFMGQNYVITSNLYQNRNPRGRITQNVSSCVIFGVLVQKFIFLDGASGHFGFRPLAENASIF